MQSVTKFLYLVLMLVASAQSEDQKNPKMIALEIPPEDVYPRFSDSTFLIQAAAYSTPGSLPDSNALVVAVFEAKTGLYYVGPAYDSYISLPSKIVGLNIGQGSIGYSAPGWLEPGVAADNINEVWEVFNNDISVERIDGETKLIAVPESIRSRITSQGPVIQLQSINVAADLVTIQYHIVNSYEQDPVKVAIQLDTSADPWDVKFVTIDGAPAPVQ